MWNLGLAAGKSAPNLLHINRIDGSRETERLTKHYTAEVLRVRDKHIPNQIAETGTQPATETCYIAMTRIVNHAECLMPKANPRTTAKLTSTDDGNRYEHMPHIDQYPISTYDNALKAHDPSYVEEDGPESTSLLDKDPKTRHTAPTHITEPTLLQARLLRRPRTHMDMLADRAPRDPPIGNHREHQYRRATYRQTM